MAQNFQGTRDWLGFEARQRQRVVEIVRGVFESFGFEPLETPIIETIQTLIGKAGEESETRLFRLSGIGSTDLSRGGLRFDHTVPLARAVAQHWEKLVLPYRRYAIGPVLRDEATQVGRYREFTQCDYDTVGSSSLLVDSEIPAMNYTVLSLLGFPRDSFSVQINDRRLLNAMVAALGVTDRNLTLAIFRAWDKLEKAPREQIDNELSLEGADKRLLKRFNAVTDALLEAIDEPVDIIMQTVNSVFDNNGVRESIQRMDTLFSNVTAMGVPDWAYTFSPLLARGLTYYTGPIFETVVTTSDIGSITGGGRYDQLIETLGGPDLPASGSSFGLERMINVMQKLGITPSGLRITDVFITIFDQTDPTLVQASFLTASRLRQDGLNVEVYTGDNNRLGKQLDICRRRNIPIAIVIGPDEIVNGTIAVRNMNTGTQVLVTSEDLISTVREYLTASGTG